MSGVGSSSNPGDPLPPSYLDITDHLGPIADPGLPPDYDQDNQATAATPRPLAQRETRDFEYKLEKRGKPFMVMTLVTFGSHWPVFIQGSPIEGKVHLTLSQPDLIHSVILSVRGFIVKPGVEAYEEFTTLVFLEITQKLWSQESQKNNKPLHGDHTWPFSMSLPEEVGLTYGADQQRNMFRLPQTFNNPRFAYSSGTIRYEVSVKIVRKSFLKSDDLLSTPFVYIPIIPPPPMPPLRRLAYEEGQPLHGPKVDPDGWYLQKSVQIEGIAFKDHSARLECRLFLAKPLSYTRGSVVPLFMSLESDDRQVLDLLSSPSAISVRVRRARTYPPLRIHDKYSQDSSVLWSVRLDHSQRAVWWPATENPDNHSMERSRRFNGELHLKPDMHPTAAMGKYKMEYSVVLLQFNTPAFQVAEGPVLLEQPITIVTAFAPGPRPRATTPADYSPDAISGLRNKGESPITFY